MHKGLQRLYSEGQRERRSARRPDKLRKMFAFMDAINDADELRSLEQ
jgi:hypothetical protein